MAALCPISADNVFGPIIDGCNHVDFTLLFEQTIFSILPSTLLLFVAPLRVSEILQKPVKVLKQRGVVRKLTILLSLAAVQIASLVQWSIIPHVRTKASVAAAVLSLVSVLALVTLSYLEHTRSTRPSALITVYLVLSLVLDIPQARTLWIRDISKSFAALFVTGLALKATALFIESLNKRGALKAPYSTYPPEALSSVVNRSFQWWLNPLFVRGFRQVLSVDHLFSSDNKLSSKRLQTNFQRHWSQASRNASGHPLRRALAANLKYEILATLLVRLLLIGFKFCQPLLINRVVATLSSASDQRSFDKFLIAAAALIYTGLAVSNSLFTTRMNRTMTMVRGILVSKIFEHTIESSNSSSGDKGPLTLMTTDVQRIITNLEHAFEGIAGAPVEIIIAVVLLSRQIGWVSTVPVIISVLATTWGLRNSGSAAPLQRAWVMATQERITFTAGVLRLPRAMKMLGLTDLFRSMIQDYRFREVEQSKPMLRFGTLRNVVGFVPVIFAPTITLTIFVLAKNHGVLNVEQAFTTLSTLALLTNPVESMVQAIPQLGSATACLDRIEGFLLQERDDASFTTSAPQSLNLSTTTNDEQIEMGNACVSSTAVRYNESGRRVLIDFTNASLGYPAAELPILRNITTTILEHSTTLIYGPIGCGKSTFVKALSGTTRLFNGSIHPFDGKISYCAQEAWLPNLTIRDVIVMHQPYDSRWYNKVLYACCLRSDLERMSEGDQTKIGTNGLSLSGGQRQRIALARALYARNQLLLADDILSGLDSATSKQVFDRAFGPSGICRSHDITPVLVTRNTRFAPGTDRIVVFGDDGKIATQGSFDVVRNYLGHNGGAAAPPVDDVLEQVDQLTTPERQASAKDVDQEHENDHTRKTGDFSVYKYYLEAAGWIASCGFFVLTSGFIFCLLFPQVWLKWWAEAANHTSKDNTVYIAVYFCFAVAANILGGCGMLFFTTFLIPLTSRNLHRNLLNAVLSAPYSYFTSTDAGVILNRFSQDMAMIDVNLGGAAFLTLTFTLQAIMESGLIVAGSVYLVAAIPALLIALYGIQSVYLRTSRQLRYLDLETQAPLQTHFLESIDGLATVRAFGWQEAAQEANWTLLDLSQRPYYLLRSVQVWLGVVLDLVTAGLAVLIVTIAVSISTSTSAGSIGISLISILGFNTTLSTLIKSWTSMETSLGAVARVKNFVAINAAHEEAETNMVQPPQEWPLGQVTFDSLTVTYDAAAEPVLSGLNLHINPGEKIGLCGRTGSGKSSAILALFRMLQTTSGSLTIDGIDIAHIPHETLCSRFNAIPQEPLLLPGSLRFNVDPLGRARDDEIILALEKVKLWEILGGREGGLEGHLDQNVLSAGQQQLLGVARAILRKSKILLLDEVTSSMDAEAEDLTMRLIQSEFENCTVIAVAHRLKTLLEFDRIIVLEKGMVAEIGSPAEMLNGETIFKNMFEGS